MDVPIIRPIPSSLLNLEIIYTIIPSQEPCKCIYFKNRYIGSMWCTSKCTFSKNKKESLDGHGRMDSFTFECCANNYNVNKENKDGLTFAEWMKKNYPKEILTTCEYDEYYEEYSKFVGGKDIADLIENKEDEDGSKTFFPELLKKANEQLAKSNFPTIKKIVDEVIREDLRKEAMQILGKASPFRKNELINYYNQGKHNIVCMHIDTIKEELVFYKIMEQKETDNFGKIYK